MNDRQGFSQPHAPGQQQAGAQAPQTWQFTRPQEASHRQTASEAVPPQQPVSAFQFVRPQPAEEAPKGSFDSSSEEFSRIIDQKIARRRRNGRISFLVTMALLFGSTAGGAGWFISNPDRVTAFKAVLADLKSVTDVQSMKAKYNEALAKIGRRKGQIDEATSMMGIDPSKQVAHEDEYFDKEMKDMMGEGGGPSVGERNRNFAATADKLMKAGLLKDSPPAGESK
ncbi:hypothetical protein OVA24_04475 [Luteolibacter sp. SL250]|uniref:hypothetical protein n=1 Tax=Luteolibacter sp. SL250 TaxID=2995170 RepID=UPI00226FE8C4|nr:hypothetical protein [Luteolibacter sp. SL250]WAC20634.1 hypothetical protein OVA24_04475 [Luteolibacter sp. SL250]